MLGLEQAVHEAKQLHHQLILPQIVPQLVDDDVAVLGGAWGIPSGPCGLVWSCTAWCWCGGTASCTDVWAC